MKIETILRDMVKRGASDLHVRVGGAPVYRIDGKLYRLQLENITREIMEEFLVDLLGAAHLEKFKEEKDLDFAYGVRGVGRFRVNAFQQRSSPALAIRSVSLSIPDFESLGLPGIIRDLSLKTRGLLLVTGATGSGKSTTLASMVDHINDHTTSNIITIEDPIEYLHKDKKSMVSQRELGYDTKSFGKALRGALRQDPDVILVGEIRDEETMSIALTAADTGHLVMSTLHTMNAIESINRIISFYPPHQQSQVRLLLSNTLIGVVSLRLMPVKNGSGRVPACEVMINNAHIREMIMDEKKTPDIMQAIQEGFHQYGSQSFDQAIMQLYNDEKITKETACRYASNPDDFELRLKGIEGTSDRSWTGV